ncbi:MAG: hypothetical protein LBD70_04000, partial [Bifidobacteriaceae bacterium]|nr:hypothetical protein [Bifidobacteriaceae bacterium]
MSLSVLAGSFDRPCRAPGDFVPGGGSRPGQERQPVVAGDTAGAAPPLGDAGAGAADPDLLACLEALGRYAAKREQTRRPAGLLADLD